MKNTCYKITNNKVVIEFSFGILELIVDFNFIKGIQINVFRTKKLSVKQIFSFATLGFEFQMAKLSEMPIVIFCGFALKLLLKILILQVNEKIDKKNHRSDFGSKLVPA